MPTLRERMTNAIKFIGHLDYVYQRDITSKDPRRFDTADYKRYLDNLDDDDFLMAYNRVQEAEIEGK